ncbi:MAG TPA: DeoR/GlpR transcriptional regulator [Clostridiaceae bacterium]|nr:DeoR/GlpR transcriptional regulator [Clostridiaceae bacterium]
MVLESNSKSGKRQQEIYNLLELEGYVQISELSESMGVTPVTIRNDLDILEEAGYARRILGGAILPPVKNPLHNRSVMEHNVELKIELGKLAAQLVANGETLLIGSGTTTYYFALELKNHQNLNIVTNSIPIAVAFHAKPGFRTILLGGNVTTQHIDAYAFTFGDEAYEQMRKYRADKTFLSWDGISIHSGYTTYNVEEANLNKLMMKHANETIVIADSTKLGRETFTRVAPIDSADYIVTNPSADPSLLEELRLRGVKILTQPSDLK